MVDVNAQIDSRDPRPADERGRRRARTACRRCADAIPARSTTCGMPSPPPSGSPGGSCRSRATSASAAATSSKATPAARCWSARPRTAARAHYRVTWEYGGGVTRGWSSGSRRPSRSETDRRARAHLAEIADVPAGILGPVRPRSDRSRLGRRHARTRAAPRDAASDFNARGRRILDVQRRGPAFYRGAADALARRARRRRRRSGRRCARGRCDVRLLHRRPDGMPEA